MSDTATGGASRPGFAREVIGVIGRQGLRIAAVALALNWAPRFACRWLPIPQHTVASPSALGAGEWAAVNLVLMMVAAVGTGAAVRIVLDDLAARPVSVPTGVATGLRSWPMLAPIAVAVGLLGVAPIWIATALSFRSIGPFAQDVAIVARAQFTVLLGFWSFGVGVAAVAVLGMFNPVAVHEGRTLSSAMARSARLMRGHRWSWTLLYVALTFAQALPATLFTLLLAGPVARLADPAASTRLFYDVTSPLSALFSALWVVMVTVGYIRLRRRGEGMLMEDAATVFD